MMTNRSYGLLVLVVLGAVGLYTLNESRASVYQPGWFYRWRNEVWCTTTITIRPVDSAPQVSTFTHYPGKSVERLVNTYVPHAGLRQTFLNEEVSKTDTTCYPTWKEAAAGDPMFVVLSQKYAPMIAKWDEADYAAALTFSALGKGENGQEALTSYMARLAAEENFTPAGTTPTPNPMQPEEMVGVLCYSAVTHPNWEYPIGFRHPAGDRTFVENFLNDYLDHPEGTLLVDYQFQRTVCWEDWEEAYFGLKLEERLYADTYLPIAVQEELQRTGKQLTEAQYRDIVLEVVFLDLRPELEPKYFSQ
jgi:hypothetical protein